MQCPYLEDKNFLVAIDNEMHKEQFVRITILDFSTELVKANIEGKATSGSCNLDGNATMRRVASCSLVVDPEGIDVQGYSTSLRYYDIAEVQNLISMNKKVKLYTGFKNTLKEEYPTYANYDIIWFPLGLYVVKSANVSRNNTGINISLSLNDKSALLNGDMGGIIPAATIFSESEIYNSTGTSREIEKILIKDIIKYLVVEFGGEDPANVIVTDIPDYITKVMKWNDKKNDLYIYQEGKDGGIQYSTSLPAGIKAKQTCKYGEDIGYTLEPFVYPGTLECNAGESVAAILDKIKTTLGNFEWFYDIHGRFHFQEIKNYLYTPITKEISELDDGDYLSYADMSMSEYTFNNQKIIASLSSAPQYGNIKNDYVVWGTTKSATGADKPIRYHIAIDTKPTNFNDKMRFCLVYKDYKGLQQVVVLKENENYINGEPSINSDRSFYYINKTDNETSVYHWDDTLEIPNFRKLYLNEEDGEAWLCYLKTTDWRTELYFQGLEASNKTFSKNYYSAELNAEWPKIYNVMGKLEKNLDIDPPLPFPVYSGAYREEVATESYEYWLDFLEGSSDYGVNISQFNVNNIGRRSKVVSDKSANCVFPVDYSERNYILIEADGDTSKDRYYVKEMSREAVQVSSEIWKKMTLGGSRTSAFERIKELLFTHTNYNESINLSVIPIYHLEPNTRITVLDNSIGINGDYLIKTISLPLTVNSTSNISATKCLEKTF